MTAAFSLYRSGWSDGTPWSDNQLWARRDGLHVMADSSNAFILAPVYGSGASLYNVRLEPAESAEAAWTSWRATLIIDGLVLGEVPLSWYVGSPSDWPSGIARFPEVAGPRMPTHTFSDGPRGVWTLAVRRER